MDSKRLYLYLSLCGGFTTLLATSIVISLSSVLTMTEPLQLVLVFFGGAVILTVLGVPLVRKLDQITHALQQLEAQKNVTTLHPLPLGILTPLIAQINAIIDGQQDFQNARGRLYKQIHEVAAQEERKRLARDLHDSIKQQVFSISISAAAAEAHLNNNMAAAREALLVVKRSAQEAMVEMRALLQQLAPAPLEKSGLIEALREQAEALSYRTGATVDMSFDQIPSNDVLPIGTQEAIFRITQEALSNIARHARAKTAHLALSTAETHLKLRIVDDGQGFDTSTATNGMGLSNIARRVAEISAAELTLTSQPGQGTSVVIHIPIQDKTNEEEKRKMENQIQSQAQQVMHAYISVGVALSFALLGALLAMIESFQEALPTVIGGSITVAVIALGSTAYFARQLSERWHIYREFNAENRRASDLYLQARTYQVNMVVVMILLFMVPNLLLEAALAPWWATGLGLLFLSVVVAYLLGSAFAQHHLIAYTSGQRRADILREMRSEVFSNWFATGAMSLAILLPSTAYGVFLPAQNPDQWDSNFFTGMIFAFVTYCILWSIIYLHWNRKTNESAESV